ncbi:hypothetical protein PFISCL1PPCAC_779, partial [Pristionchus fissidentatus]
SGRSTTAMPPKDKYARSSKSNRHHERFKDLYAAHSPHPDVANRAPRKVPPQSQPSTETTTTGNDVTPTTTPINKTPKKKPKPKKAKWSHVPSASDGEATHFENFENDGCAQLAVAKMKTRELQWKSTETVDQGPTMESTDAAESYRQELDSTGIDEARLRDLERTQEDDGMRDQVKKEMLTMEEPDTKEIRQEPTVRKQVTPPKVVLPPVPTIREIPKPKAEVTKRESGSGKKEDKKEKEKIKASARDTHKRAVVQPVQPVPPVQQLQMQRTQQPTSNTQGTTREEITQRDKKQSGVVVKKKEEKEPTTPNYLLAVKLMKILKRNNYLENALQFEHNEILRKYFETGAIQPPPKEILALLQRAMLFVLDTVLFRSEDLDTYIASDLKAFIIKRNEARDSMIQVMYNRPELRPNKWGGARIEQKRSKTSKSREDGGKKRGWFGSFFR